MLQIRLIGKTLESVFIAPKRLFLCMKVRNKVRKHIIRVYLQEMARNGYFLPSASRSFSRFALVLAFRARALVSRWPRLSACSAGYLVVKLIASRKYIIASRKYKFACILSPSHVLCVSANPCDHKFRFVPITFGVILNSSSFVARGSYYRNRPHCGATGLYPQSPYWLLNRNKN